MNQDKKNSSAGGSGRPSVSVIIPVYSGDSYLFEMLDKLCLSGLRRNAGKRIELVIVDDRSPLEAETAALVRAASEWADVVYHRNPVNLGYIRSANKGMALASGSRFLLCNSDTRIAPGALARLEAALDADPGVGLAGPVTNGGYNTPLQQLGELPAPLESFSDGELFRIDDFGRSLAGRGLRPVAAHWLISCCTLIRREVFETVGPLDEGFKYGYMEDLDYGIRAARSGWKLAAVPDAFVFHGGLRKGWTITPNGSCQTSGSSKLRTLFQVMRSVLYMARKYGLKAISLPQGFTGAGDASE